MTNSIRDDFTQKIKDLLAKRAGHTCSRCKCPTSGPKEGNGAVNIGVAAHICAASAGGPRYDTTMTREQRKSIENGIWMCSTCSDIIDRNPEKYTVDALQELKIKSEQNAEKHLGVPKSQKNEYLFLALFYESNGNCLRCGNALALHKKGAVASCNCEIIYLTKIIGGTETDDNAILLCKDCIPFVPNMSIQERDDILNDKQRLAADMIILDEVSGIKIAKEIENVLREIDKVKNETELASVDITELIEIERKISELYLRSKINASMVRLFKTVNDICARLEQEIGFDTERFGRAMKYTLGTIESEIKERNDITDIQAFIEDVLVEKLYLRVGQKYKAACEIIVAYLIKRCDLFDENAKQS